MKGWPVFLEQNKLTTEVEAVIKKQFNSSGQVVEPQIGALVSAQEANSPVRQLTQDVVRNVLWNRIESYFKEGSSIRSVTPAFYLQSIALLR